jgi:hypothetical protein
MTKILFLVHPNGKSRRLKLGFCWFGFFLPVVWAVSEGLWRPFAFSLLGYYLLSRASDLARDLKTPAFVLLAFTYIVVMVIFGLYGKKWLASELLSHGYREVHVNEAREDSHLTD